MSNKARLLIFIKDKSEVERHKSSRITISIRLWRHKSLWRIKSWKCQHFIDSTVNFSFMTRRFSDEFREIKGILYIICILNRNSRIQIQTCKRFDKKNRSFSFKTFRNQVSQRFQIPKLFMVKETSSFSVLFCVRS